jgi:hypothetical protein
MLDDPLCTAAQIGRFRTPSALAVSPADAAYAPAARHIRKQRRIAGPSASGIAQPGASEQRVRETSTNFIRSPGRAARAIKNGSPGAVQVIATA